MSMMRRPRMPPIIAARGASGQRHAIARDGPAPVADRRGFLRAVVELGVAVGGHLALQWERAADGVVRLAGDDEVLRREARDHLAAVLRDDELLLDARSRPAVARRPERLEREDHALADLLGVLDRDEPAEDRLLPDRQPDAVAELEGERRLLVGEAELLGLGPDLDDLARRGARADARDRGVEVV